ncbi:PDZ domain-containing protein [Rheinheimera marina]|uniref:PDZ domain-containing protein n=1 Tax=Rheinheimera marina TaxID=1774958 RepID=A0ABV9JKQ1_9GAMM
MKKPLVTALIVVCCWSSQTMAAGLGLVGDVSVSGMFSPEVQEFKIKQVHPGSLAEKAGLVAGQTILAIDDCKIPGCPANKARTLMKKATGETLQLLVANPDGKEQLVSILFE